MTLAKRVVTFRPDQDMLKAMEHLRDVEGVIFSQQIRRALSEWLTAKGVMKADRKRARSRKQP